MKICFIFFLLILSIVSNAQTNSCGFDAIRKVQLKSHPKHQNQEKRCDEQIYNSISSLNNKIDLEEATTLIIPVVYHIIHLNGPENVADSIITNSINELNLRFQNATPYFDSSGNAVDIQFCLASVDPNGDSTNGITRDTSVLTNFSNYLNINEQIRLKNIKRWCPETYLNIWVLNSIGGWVAGFSSYPGINMPEIDGIVCEYTSLSGHLLTHEVGHYFNLYHTFESFGVPLNCKNYNCLLNGDRVCDTPPDSTNDNSTCISNSCSTEMNDTSGFNPFTTNQNDLPNYMDYTSCPLSFSAGQVARMKTALNLFRSNLIQSNGCGNNPGGLIPNASFVIDSSGSHCSRNGTVNFYSTSANSLYTAWDFDNDGKIDGIGDSVGYTYPSSGNYTVRIIVTGFGGSDTVSKLVNVYINPYPTYPISTFYSGLVLDPINHYPTACKGDTITLFGTPGMSSYLWSNGDTTQNITFIADSSDTINLTVIDTSGRIIMSCDSFIVNVFRPLKLAMTRGSDTVNCQEYIVFQLLPNTSSLPANNVWYHDRLSSTSILTNSFFYAKSNSPTGINRLWGINIDPIGCTTYLDTISYFVKSPPPLKITQIGNLLKLPYKCLATEWYKDGIFQYQTVSDSTYIITSNGCYYAYCKSCGNYVSDTICINNLGINENVTFANSINIFPNPFSSSTTIYFDVIQEGTDIIIMDVLGQIVKSVSFSGKKYIIKEDDLLDEVYFVQIIDNKNFKTTKKLILMN